MVVFYISSERLLITVEDHLYEQKIEHMKKDANMISSVLLADMTNDVVYTEEKQDTDDDQVSHALTADETDTLHKAIQQYSNDLNGRVIVLNSDFRIIFDSYELNEYQRFITPDIITLFKENQTIAGKYDDNTAQVMMSVYDEDQDMVIAAVLMTSSLSSESRFMAFLLNQKWTLYGIEMIFSVLIGFLFLVITSRGFHSLNKELSNLEQGFNKDHQIREEGFREFYKLSVTINRILNRYQEMENSRQEFVSNVSHELKTPITSMKVLADSLVSMDNVPVEIYEEFMQDIVHEIDRENQIITDLLSLVKMDKSSSDLNITSVNINELLQILLKRLLPIAQQRNISMKLTTMRQVMAEVDEVKLSLACNNLIENAIKYNNDGGNVDVSLNADHKFFYIRVKDTGVGIPEECQEQIFERFYRVDKARSRDTGGTGLGLAITRNVVLLHKGSIRVHSKEGHGTTFTVRIPLNYIG